jgi:hypothetical protein
VGIVQALSLSMTSANTLYIDATDSAYAEA